MMRKLLPFLCGIILAIILVAGLWPFHAPRNHVAWLGQENGLQFGKHGSILSAHEFLPTPKNSDGCTLEILLAPKRLHASGTILAFYSSDGVIPFALRQSLGDLVLLSRKPASSTNKRPKIYVDDAFRSLEPVLVSIRSDLSETKIFVNGISVKKSSLYKLSARDFTGRLVMGNSPVTTDDWSGQLKALAIYNSALTAEEITQNYARWKNGDSKTLALDKRAAAVYSFEEEAGEVIHNRVDSSTDLVIPRRFFVLHAQFLERPWDEYRPDWNYWKDVAINIAGFIPLGFFFCAYFGTFRSNRHAAAKTIAFGFAVSLAIEVLQSFLPTRDSGMTDLITNTLGTAIGVGTLSLFQSKPLQALFPMAGILHVTNKSVWAAR